MKPGPGEVSRGNGPNSAAASPPKQPPICTRVLLAGLKHATSSPSGGLPLSAPPDIVQAPPSLATASQYSKWPISSENATLYEWAAHGTRVCSLDVEYIGWKA